ncbi:hypothetical protein ACLB2K_060416 [Fragaria x ananassa]
MSKRQISHEGSASNRARKAGPISGDKTETELMWAKMRDVQNKMLLLTKRVSQFEPTMGKVVEVVDEVKRTLQSSLNEEKLAKIMKDVICQVRMEEEENDNLPRKSKVKEVTEVRSNNGNFAGLTQSKLKRYQNLSGGKQAQWKNGNVSGSECSVSPLVVGIKTKGKEEGSIPKKTRVVPLPKYQRALFRDDKDGGTLIKDLKKVAANKVITRAGPFTSKIPLCKDDARITEYIFYKRAITESDYNQQVCSCDGSFMTRNDMRCLRPHGLVYSTLIDTYTNYLNNGGPDWYMNTKLCVIACGGMAEHKTYEDWIQHTTSLSGMKRFYGRIGDCDRIFIPMFDPQTKTRIGHWYLLVIHVKDRYVELIDSLEEEARLVSRRHDAKSVMDMLDVILGDDIIKLLEPMCTLSSLPWAYNTPIRQPNCRDCGIFVIRNMEDPTSKWADQYDSHTQRLRLLLDCVRHDKNEVTDLQVKVEQSLIIWKGGKGNKKASKAAPVIVSLMSEDADI